MGRGRGPLKPGDHPVVPGVEVGIGATGDLETLVRAARVSGPLGALPIVQELRQRPAVDASQQGQDTSARPDPTELTYWRDMTLTRPHNPRGGWEE